MGRLLTTIAVAMILLFTASAQAQSPGGQPGGAMPPGMKAMEKWRESHPHILSLQNTLRGFAVIDRNPTTQFTKAQARIVLAVFDKWRFKPVLTDAQAKQVEFQLTAPLTDRQLKKIAAMDARRSGFRDSQPAPPPGGFGGPPPGNGNFGNESGGPPPGGMPGGPPPGMMLRGAFPAPHDYNPLNPSTLPFGSQSRQVLDLKQFIAIVQKQAK